MRTSLVSVVVVLLSFILAGGAAAKPTAQMQRVRVVHDIVWNRQSAWHWQDRAAVPRTRSEFSERHVKGMRYLLWERRLWSRRRVMALRFARAHPVDTNHRAFWMCVASGWTGGAHGYGRKVSGGEGGWTSVNPAGYYGAFQNDYGFMRNWGGWALRRWGTADHWPPNVQLAVAEIGFQHQGPGAWPNTAYPCLFLR